MRTPDPTVIEAACDEVGRGSLLYDVVAACVVLPPVESLPDDRWKAIRDSKRLSAKKRKELAAYIKDVALAWAIGTASSEEIDRINILRATMRAMHRALDGVHRTQAFARILVDGDKFEPYLPPGEGAECVEHECVEGGDDSVLAIAAASIVAKDFRDAKVAELVRDHPELKEYDIESSKGYGTRKHLEAIRRLGPTPFHRKSFKPCRPA